MRSRLTPTWQRLGVALLVPPLFSWACELDFRIQNERTAESRDGGAGGQVMLGGAPGASGGSATGGAGPGSGGSGGEAPELPECEAPLFASHLSLGEEHACIIEKGSGKLFCWGMGDSGQLGDGDGISSPWPIAVDSDAAFKDVAALGVSTCALEVGGTVQCFGNNFDGVLADGTSQSSLLPVATLAGAVRIAGASGYLLAVENSGDLYAWGGNEYGQLGLGAPSVGLSVRTETLVGDFAFVALAAGNRHTCGILSGGALYCAGDNNDFRLGRTGEASSTFALITEEYDFAEVEAGLDRSCAITTAGQLYCWGSNIPITFPGLDPALDEPTLVDHPKKVQAVAIGYQHVCWIDEDGVLSCVGENDHGQLGISGGASPEIVHPFSRTRFKEVSAGSEFTCALRDPDGAIVCFGQNAGGQLGLGSTDAVPLPRSLVCPEP